MRHRLKSLNEKVRLHGDESQHEQTDAWSNRDLIPLPPHRRTWGMIAFSRSRHLSCPFVLEKYADGLQVGFISSDMELT